MHYRTFIGLDVHARSVKAGLLDGETGEIAVRSAPARTEALVEWVLASPGPAAVAYEAGPRATAWRKPSMRSASPAWWPPPVASRAPPATASRPTAVTPCAWHGCCASMSSSRYAYQAARKRRRATSCAPAKTLAQTSCALATGSPSCCCVRALCGRAAPAALPALGGLRRARQALHGGSRGRGARAGRLVLEPGHDGALRPTPQARRSGERARRARGASATAL